MRRRSLASIMSASDLSAAKLRRLLHQDKAAAVELFDEPFGDDGSHDLR
jgi:hypothetical protein